MTPSSDHDVEIVQLTTAGSELEGLMWQDMLLDAGIKVMLRPGGPGAGGWASAATFEHTLFVRADQLDAARTVLGNARDLRSRAPRARRSVPIVNRRRVRSDV